MNGHSKTHDNDSGGDDPSQNTVGIADLYRKYSPSVLRFLASKVFHPEDAEDLAAETWKRALASFDVSQVPHFQARIITIARNAHTDWVRRQAGGPGRLPEDYDPAHRPDEADVRSDTADALQHCLESVDEPFRSALRAKLAGCSYQEISERFAITIGTVSSQISRAKAQIRACIEGRLA